MIRKISAIILIVFFFLLPFHAFLVTWLNVGLGLDSILITLWRELFIAILTILAIGDVILRRRPESFDGTQDRLVEGLSNVILSPVLSLSKGDSEPLRAQLKKITLLDWLIAAYFLLGAIFFFYKRESISQWLLGARYDFEFLYFYWLVRVFGFGKREIWTFFESAMTAAVLVVIFGWVLYFLPQDFLTKFGYAAYADEWNPGSAVFACHYVEFDQSFCRMQSTFGGPGRYGLYLLFVTIAFTVILSASVAKQQKAKDLSKIHKLSFFYTKILRSLQELLPQDDNNAVLGRRPNLHCHCEEAASRPVPAKAGKQSPREHFNIRQQLFWLIFLLLSLGALYLTLSRSAWIGLFGTLAVCAIFLIKKLPKWKCILAKSAVVAAIGALIFTFLAPTSFKTIIIRSASTSQHIEAFVKGVQTAVAHPFGIGLGKAGPASVPFEKFLTENAYLQVIVEMGFLGGALFLAILIVILSKAKDLSLNTHPISLNFPLYLISLLTLISLILSGLFVHSFEEMSLNLTLFGLIGLITERKFLIEKSNKKENI